MSLRSSIRRALGLAAPQRVTRSLDAAAGGRRWQGVGATSNLNSAIIASRAETGRRARYLAGSTALAASGVAVHVSAHVGTGIKPSSGHPDRETINGVFAIWTDRADADGLCDFYALQALAVRRMVVDGEAQILMLTGNDGALTLRMVPAEQLDGSMTRDLPGGGRIIAGVEFGASGRRVAYHIFLDRPGEFRRFRPVRIPAEDVIHMFRPETPGQVRGLSWFAPILLRLRDYDEAIDAQLMRQKISALLCGFVVNPDGGPASFDGETENGVLTASLEPGQMNALKPGEDVRLSDPARIGAEAIDFLKISAREIAAGLGVP